MEKNIHLVVSVFIDAVLKTFLEVGLCSLQQCFVDLSDFHLNSFLQIIHCMGQCVFTHALRYSPQEVITHGQIRGPRSICKLRNESTTKERARNIYQYSVCVGCHFILLMKPYTLNWHTFSL